MTKASDNAFPSILITEGTEPAAPAAGKQRLYIDSTTHLLKRTDSSGTDVTIEGGSPSGSITASGYTQTTARLLGRTTASTGAIEEITVGSGLSLSAGSLTATGGSGGALVFLTTQTASASATLDFTTWYSATYDEYVIEFLNLIPASAATQAWLRMSTDGGSTYDSGANYAWTDMRIGPGGAASGGATGANQIVFTGGGNSETLPTTSTKGLSGSLKLFSPASTAVHKTVKGESVFDSSSGLLVAAVIAGQYRSTTAVNAFRVLMASGNITSGIVRVYGITKA